MQDCIFIYKIHVVVLNKIKFIDHLLPEIPLSTDIRAYPKVDKKSSLLYHFKETNKIISSFKVKLEKISNGLFSLA